MGRGRWFLLILIVVVSSVWSASSAWANGVMLSPIESAALMGVMVASCLCFTVLVEYLVALSLLGWRGVAKLRLFGWIVFVNLLTNIPAQFAVIYIGRATRMMGALWGVTLLIELAVVALEFLLLYRIFARMYRRGELSHPVTSYKAFSISLIANAASFAVGYVIGYIFLLPKDFFPLF